MKFETFHKTNKTAIYAYYKFDNFTYNHVCLAVKPQPCQTEY